MRPPSLLGKLLPRQPGTLGADAPKEKRNLSATSVSTQVNFGVDLLTFRPYIAYKRRKAKNYKIVPVMFWPTL